MLKQQYIVQMDSQGIMQYVRALRSGEKVPYIVQYDCAVVGLLSRHVLGYPRVQNCLFSMLLDHDDIFSRVGEHAV